MCGRYTLTADAERIFEEYGIGVPADYEPRWNIAPGTPILALAATRDGELRAGWLHWGLIPPWQRGGGGRPLVNLRSETIRKTAGRLLEHRRCAIPADGFYEWLRAEGKRVPYHLHHPDGQVFTMAGVWNRSKTDAGETVHTVAILTTDAAGAVRPIHDRMPVILTAEARARWLDPRTSPDQAEALLCPLDPDLEATEVSPRVNDARYDAPDCVDPV